MAGAASAHLDGHIWKSFKQAATMAFNIEQMVNKMNSKDTLTDQTYSYHEIKCLDG